MKGSRGLVHGDYDAVVIGSGMGGLSAAALLAQLHGQRVLVLERHWRAGGFTHTFSRPGGYRWDVGVHYVGQVERGTTADVLRVVSGGALAWRRMPDPFERLVFPGFEFSIRSGRDNFLHDLVDAFPSEKKALRRWLVDVERAAGYTAVLGMRGAAPEVVARAAEAVLAGRRRLAARTTGAHLEGHFEDPRLRGIVGARWVDYGLPPAQSAFLAHAIITAHYLEGAFYPAGSAARIAETALRTIGDAGGALRVSVEVESILVREGRARGVRLSSGEEILSPVVISDAGARNTFLRLVPEDVPLPFRDALRAIPTGMATVTLYLGLSRSPASLGVQGENFWIHDAFDQDALWARRREAVAGAPALAYLSFPSLKDPEARVHTAEIVSPVDAADFARWEGTTWKKRAPEYQALKDRIADGLLALVEKRLPGFRELVAYRELSTPLTTGQFTAHAGGESYAIPWTPERLRNRWLSVRTPVPGLFLTGADAFMLGVVGTAMSGLMCAAAVAGPATFAKLRSAARRLAVPATPATATGTSPSIV